MCGAGGAGEREAAASAFCIEVSRSLFNALYTGNSAKVGGAWYLFADPPPQHHAQVYAGEQEAMIDPALWMRTRAAFGASSRASRLALGAMEATPIMSAGNRR